MVYDCLTKENFWDKIYELYPEKLQEFYDWIDQYKKRPEWKLIIQERVKFHELPFDLQFGIMVRYNQEVLKLEWDGDLVRPAYMKQDIMDLFFRAANDLN
jgi:hypothetical protein